MQSQYDINTNKYYIVKLTQKSPFVADRHVFGKLVSNFCTTIVRLVATHSDFFFQFLTLIT